MIWYQPETYLSLKSVQILRMKLVILVVLCVATFTLLSNYGYTHQTIRIIKLNKITYLFVCWILEACSFLMRSKSNKFHFFFFNKIEWSICRSVMWAWCKLKWCIVSGILKTALFEINDCKIMQMNYFGNRHVFLQSPIISVLFFFWNRFLCFSNLLSKNSNGNKKFIIFIVP